MRGIWILIVCTALASGACSQEKPAGDGAPDPEIPQRGPADDAETDDTNGAPSDDADEDTPQGTASPNAGENDDPEPRPDEDSPTKKPEEYEIIE